jgi:predicted RNA-binding protein with PIN domain
LLSLACEEKPNLRAIIMPYLIDGHNLIGALPAISLDDPNDEALLVQKLSGFVARTKQKCVVIFDQGLPGGASRMSTRGVRVVFASHQSTADRVMIDRIQKERNPRLWRVVTSDIQVLDAARRRGMAALTSAEFVHILQRPEPPSRPGPDEAEDVRLSEKEVDEWLALFKSRNK